MPAVMRQPAEGIIHETHPPNEAGPHMNRRSLLGLGGLASGALLLRPKRLHAAPTASAVASPDAAAAALAPPPGSTATTAARRGSQVITPNGASLAWQRRGNVKVGHLIASEIEHEFAPGIVATCWGYNGGTPGPTIEGIEGERVRIYVTNRLPEPTTVHWHGMVNPPGMDGVAGLTQKAIAPGQTFRYEFTLPRAATYMYHPHYDEMTQMALGMVGMFIVHPRVPRTTVAHDFALMTHEWQVRPGTTRPNPMAMSDFNMLTFNSKVYPATAPLLVQRGERVRIRLGNLSAMDHHPIHFHGIRFNVTETDGGAVPASAQFPETTVLVPVGTTRVIEFVPEVEGDWAMHCHMTHHVMTQMGHALPSMLGVDAAAIDRAVGPVVPGYMTMGQTGMGEMSQMQMPAPVNSTPMRGGPGPHGYIDMGGMFTILKVRDDVRRADPNAWHQPAPETQAREATRDELAADGINVTK